MKNISTITKLIFFLALLLSFISCYSQKELVRFESSGNILILTNKHILEVSLEYDTASKKYVNIIFSDLGQKLISDFTEANLNETMTIIGNKITLIKDIRIRDKFTSNSIAFSFDSDKEAKDFYIIVQGEL